jgi:hypothetical protein
LSWIGYADAIIAGITNSVTIGIGLTRVGYQRTVVTGISQTITVRVCLTWIRRSKAVVESIRHSVTIGIKCRLVFKEDILISAVTAIIPSKRLTAKRIMIDAKIITDVIDSGRENYCAYRWGHAGVRHKSIGPRSAAGA